jgi:hypothetical protein
MEPFSLGQNRFKDKNKENLGPGSYDYANRTTSPSLLRKE